MSSGDGIWVYSNITPGALLSGLRDVIQTQFLEFSF